MNSGSTSVNIINFDVRRTDELVRMWRESFEFGVGIVDPHSIEDQRDYFMTTVVPNNTVRMALLDDRLVGFIAATRESIAQLYVRKANHRCGIGTQLLAWAKAQSDGKLWLFTFARNATARAFYEKHGFKIVARGFEPTWQLDDLKYEWIARDVGDFLPRFGNGVILRRLSTSDLDMFQAYRTDPEVARFQSWPVMSSTEAAAFLSEMSTAEFGAAGDWFQLGIAERSSGLLIGDIGICVDRSDDSQAEIGFTLAAEVQGRGLASEAVREALALLFERTSVTRIVAITDTRNLSSIRLLERVGMSRRETVRTVVRGETCDEHVSFFIARDALSGARRATRRLMDQPTPRARRCRRKFLRFFRHGFRDEKYVDWERGYKWLAHQQWEEGLNRATYRALLRERKFADIASRAVRIESRTNLLFSFEKMALRDAVKSTAGARCFAEGLYDFLYGRSGAQRKFERWCEVVAALPRKQTRVLTWPLVTVFGFTAQPETHIFLKPNVTRIAAREYGYDFLYTSRPSWETYRSLLEFAETVRKDLRDLQPRDMIDIQSFIWVQGSGEYDE